MVVVNRVVRSHRSRKISVVCLAALAAIQQSAPGSTAYYVSPTGNDHADGLTPQTAWQSLDKVDSTNFAPGTQILFQRGGDWRGQLVATSDGTAAAPITYGAFGTGANPTIWGSDVVSNSQFAPLSGSSSVFTTHYSTPVNSFLADHAFLHDSALVTSSNDPATNLNYLNSNPGSYYYDAAAGQLYLNTGSDPRTDGRQYDAAVRDDVIYTKYHSNLIFDGLTTNESAKPDAGYGIRVQGGSNVLVQNSSALNAGKHNIGVIDSTGFIGKNDYASGAEPDQGGPGGATAFVSFSDENFLGCTSQWIDDKAENMGGYGAFYCHGPGLSDVLVKGMTAIEAGISGGAGAQCKIQFVDNTLVNCGISLYDTNMSAIGNHLSGPASGITTQADGNLIANNVIDGAKPVDGYRGVIVDLGTNTKILFNTVQMDPTTPLYSFAVVVGWNPDPGLKLEGNILSGIGGFSSYWSGESQFQSNGNLFSPGTFFITGGLGRTFSQWQSLGFDTASIVGTPLFVDASNGNFELRSDSPGHNASPIDAATLGLFLDYVGDSRIPGMTGNIGAVAASTVTKNGAETIITPTVRLSGLSVTAGKFQINQSGSSSGVSVLTNLSVTGGGQLDLTSTDLILNYTGTTPAGTIRGYLASGFNNGNWDGPGISSLAAHQDPNMLKAIGYAENSDLGLTSFDGEPVDGHSLLLKYTFYGDSDLNGTVDAADFKRFLDGLASGGSTWAQGDYTYDGKVDLGNDFNLFLSAYLAQGGSLGDLAAILDGGDLTATQKNQLLSMVPEPCGAGMIATAAWGLAVQRRRGRLPGTPKPSAHL